MRKHEEHASIIVDMWRSNATAQAIADHLNIGRNAVIGWINRNRERFNLELRSNEIRSINAARKREAKKAQKQGLQRRKAKNATEPPKPPQPQPYDHEKPFKDRFTPKSRPCQLFDLPSIWEKTGARCKYPVGDPMQDGFAFCGAHIRRGRTYCDEHYQVCWRPNK